MALPIGGLGLKASAAEGGAGGVSLFAVEASPSPREALGAQG